MVIGITLFHTFIFVNIPMAVPLEWNVIMVYGAWAIFMMHPSISPFSISNPYLIGLFALLFLIVPLVGTFWPKYVSFLMCMRYYAGTWAINMWLFKGDAKLKVDEHVVKTSKSVESQLEMIYDKKTVKEMLSRLMGLRLMHIPSGALHDTYDIATDGQKGYYWMDGEFFGGEVLGWSFGDGHLHDHKLLKSLQKRCNWESGEVRIISVESPQMHNGRQHWQIYDAKDGLIKEGYSFVKDYVGEPTWPEH